MTGTTLARVSIIVHGRVQGVYFRNFTVHIANVLGITGYVRNLPDSTVEADVEGEKESLEKFIAFLRKGPPGSHVIKQDITWSAYLKRYTSFEIRY